MTIVVSVSQFRQNLADYIVRAQQGHTVILKDEKKGRSIIQLVVRKEFNSKSFENTLKSVAGIFTTENHPEWQNKNKIIKWVKHERNLSERSF